MSMSSLPRLLRDLRYRLFYRVLTKRGYSLLELGNRSTGCSWTFCPDGLSPRSIVYSGGVGRDISFEHALVQRFGCSVFLFDPSPTGAETMALPENSISQFRFFPVGLAGKCTTLRLAPPLNSDEGSWFSSTGEGNSIEVPCLDLGTLMRQNRHDHIDLLKLDIEGAEYGVLDDLLQRRLPVRQIAVEFHHSNLPGIPRRQSIRMILRLIRAGYGLLNDQGNNHTFLNARLLQRVGSQR